MKERPNLGKVAAASIVAALKLCRSTGDSNRTHCASNRGPYSLGKVIEPSGASDKASWTAVIYVAATSSRVRVDIRE
ncbi:hypothetical protein CDL15_Pgr004151 [Punica granatum]|nr:hypothetical protein CDL15_Pgr004151 [Punica granatum]